MIEWTPAKKAVVAGAAIGMGLLIFSSRRRYKDHNGSALAHSLDPELDAPTRSAVLTALAGEHDPAVLSVLGAKLAAAGFDQTAATVGKRAAEVSRANSPHHVGQAFGHSAMVWHAQRMLRQLGYAVPLTGVQDDATTLAVKRFQSLHDLDIDGIIDPRTNAALAAAVAGST